MKRQHDGAVVDRSIGVSFPRADDSRSTSSFGRLTLAAALDGVDPVGSRAARSEAAWRNNYPSHFRRVIEAGLTSTADAHTIAAQGLAAVGAMRWIDPVTKSETPLAAATDPGRGLSGPPALSERFEGSARRVQELSIPAGDGRWLAGDALLDQLSEWVAAGFMEPSVAESVAWVAARPELLSLPDKTLVALGVGAEIGPTPHLLRWGATVAGVDLPRPEIWQRVLKFADATGGTVVFPAAGGMDDPSRRAGLDVLTQLPEVAAWVRTLPGDLIVGNYLYADGALNMRASSAADALAQGLLAERESTIVAALATPTDVFAVPGAAVDQSVARFLNRGVGNRISGRALGGLTRGRLLQPAYQAGVDPGICDALVIQQGPNYALGKRIQRWRATSERAAGRRTSLLVAPPTRTRSVVKNRALSAAYSGAHRFGVNVFEPQTTAALMAALLVYDVYADGPAFAHPWQAEAHNAVHGGLWRTAYSPRSALGLAALMGITRTG